MIVKIEPSGCCERKGMVQVRIAMYLEFDEYGYNRHYVYNEEIEEWQNNPFHNHFIYVEPDVSDEDIVVEAKRFCKDAYNLWKKEEKLNLRNKKIEWPNSVTQQRKNDCETKVQHLKDTPLEEQIKEEEELPSIAKVK